MEVADDRDQQRHHCADHGAGRARHRRDPGLAGDLSRWFEDLGELHLDLEVAAHLVAGIAEATGEQTTAELSARCDALLAAILQATAGKR